MGCRCNAPVDITLYYDPASPEGLEALRYIERKGVAYENLDVRADSSALKQMRALSGQTERPVIVLDGQVFIGFDPSTLEPLVPSRF